MTTVKILNSSESNEWYTPSRYVEAAREVLGGIELDPASCTEAQQTVKADGFFGLDTSNPEAEYFQDGLLEPWQARSVFLNPPYGTSGGKSNQAVWSRYLRVSYEVGLVGAAILLVNASPSEKFFAPLWRFPICFPDHRIKFDYPKIRRYWPADILARGNADQRKLLMKVPFRVWSEQHQGWWNSPKRMWVPIVEESTIFSQEVKRALGLKGLIADFDGHNIALDRADGPHQPTKAQAFIYMGPDPRKFAEVFQQFGAIVAKVNWLELLELDCKRREARMLALPNARAA